MSVMSCPGEPTTSAVKINATTSAEMRANFTGHLDSSPWGGEGKKGKKTKATCQIEEESFNFGGSISKRASRKAPNGQDSGACGGYARHRRAGPRSFSGSARRPAQPCSPLWLAGVSTATTPSARAGTRKPCWYRVGMWPHGPCASRSQRRPGNHAGTYRTGQCACPLVRRSRGQIGQPCSAALVLVATPTRRERVDPALPGPREARPRRGRGRGPPSPSPDHRGMDS